jgi:hypothetical protein
MPRDERADRTFHGSPLRRSRIDLEPVGGIGIDLPVLPRVEVTLKNHVICEKILFSIVCIHGTISSTPTKQTGSATVLIPSVLLLESA